MVFRAGRECKQFFLLDFYRSELLECRIEGFWQSRGLPDGKDKVKLNFQKYFHLFKGVKILELTPQNLLRSVY